MASHIITFSEFIILHLASFVKSGRKIFFCGEKGSRAGGDGEKGRRRWRRGWVAEGLQTQPAKGRRFFFCGERGGERVALRALFVHAGLEDSVGVDAIAF